MSAVEPVEVAKRIAAALERAGVPYAIGGALAYAYWGVARATQDVDVNLFVLDSEVGPALDALAAAGVVIDRDAAETSTRERGDAEGWLEHVRVDLFVNSIPLHDSAMTRTVEVPIEEARIHILSAEDLAVFKLLFFRGKDRVDIERMVAMRRGVLDHGYIRQWLVNTVGNDDQRVRYWDDLLATTSG